MESFISAYKTAFSRYVDLSGRTSRGGYWRFIAVNFVVSALLAVLAATLWWGFVVLHVVYLLAALLPGLGITFRRLHDSDKAGWWLLLLFLPLAGPIVLFVFYVLPSDGPNKYGPGPED
jgi:uncharacterized membrane protein YhaH (DUF805 family)